MGNEDVAYQRLYNQRIARATFEKPGDVVAWLGAVQAQDYLGALWAVGLRMRNATAEDIEQALADRTIVRTWPMRGTLHFVAPADVRWMLELLTPRVLARSRRRFQQLGLNDATLARSRELIMSALQGGKRLTRDATYKVLEAGGVATINQRGSHILSWLAQKGTLCFGPRQGKQQTFVLLDEWVPVARTLAWDEALTELARRYFTGHGPATLQDFMWWSGLTKAEAQAGLEMVKQHLAREDIDDQIYWIPSSMPTARDVSSSAYLLPVYDEYTVAYKDRSAALDPVHAGQVGNGIFSPIVVVDGRVVGTWKRRLKEDSVVITAKLLRKLSRIETHALATSAERYGAFLDRGAVMDVDGAQGWSSENMRV